MHVSVLQFSMHANLIHANIVFAVITLQRGFSADAMKIMKEKRALVGIIITFPINSGQCSFHGKTVSACLSACPVICARKYLYLYFNVSTDQLKVEKLKTKQHSTGNIYHCSIIIIFIIIRFILITLKYGKYGSRCTIQNIDNLT